MLRTGISFSTILGLIGGSALLLFSVAATAQRHGGGGMGGGGGISGISRPTGLDEKDNLKDFHKALAVQATSLQMTEFQALLKNIESLHKQNLPSHFCNHRKSKTQPRNRIVGTPSIARWKMCEVGISTSRRAFLPHRKRD